MLIHCTKKLLDELKIAPSATPDDCDPLFSWRAHVITVNRRKTVVLICDFSRYVVVLYGLKAKDFKELNQRIVAAIRHTLVQEQVNSDVIEIYLARAGEPVFVKNADRTQTARLNKACENACFALKDMDEDSSDTAGVLANHLLVGSAEKDYFHPNEKMIEDLRRLGIEPVIKCRAFELSVTLSLLPHNASRKIIVPADITFLQLHKVLQAAFGWKDHHLFDFGLFEREGQKEASVELVVSEEELEYRPANARLMKGIALSEYLPRYKYLLYHYDFGDDWHHYIEVTDVHDGFNERLPLLITGEGNTPPEDVGGEGGYEEFLEIMANPSHEEHQYTRQWAKGQGYQDFDFEQASRRVKFSLRW